MRGNTKNQAEAIESASDEDDVKITGSLSIARLLVDLDEQWPSLKFLGFGCYYAWIWLCYNSSMLVSQVGDSTLANDAVFAMYLLSTAALAVTLIGASILTSWSSILVENRLFVLGAGIVAAIGTILIPSFAGGGTQSEGFVICSIITGFGTAWVALRLGKAYATVAARQAVMYTAASFILACMLYFVTVGLPYEIGIVFMASLPVFAAMFTMTMSKETAFEENPRKAEDLPAGFFLRLIAMITVFSVIVGITRGFSTLQQSLATLDSQGVIIVFGMAAVAVAIFIIVGLTVRDFDISRLYYPAIIVAAAGILLVPFLGGATGQAGSFENQFIGVAYTVFIMVIWCLCAHVSYMTGLSPVRVFGWGRGASAAGTTIGWLLGSLLITYIDADQTLIVGVSVAMVFILFAMAMLVFNERTIGQVLKRSREGAVSSDPERMGDIFPVGMVGKKSQEAEVDVYPKEGSWKKRCLEIASNYKLSPRENDVLFLLAKGRTIDYISQNLGISFNTAKSHIRNVYVKIGVHTRQELLDMIEKRS